DRVAAVRVAHRDETLGHLADRRVPIDLLERSVRAPAQGRGQARRAVLVVVEAEGLLTGVALRRRVCFVAADALEASLGRFVETHLDAAIALAEDARGLLPVAHPDTVDRSVA